ncbi:lipopolysaccharide assembly protein LapA domain-containing protein [Pseudomonas hormoni]
MLVTLLILFLIVAFVLENQQVAIVSVFGFSSLALPMSVWLIAAMLVGMIVGPLFGLVFRCRGKLESKRVLD